MTYAAQADMVSRFGEAEMIQLTDRVGAADAIDAAILAQALADADAVIDGYLAGRYALPLASTPAIIKQYACDIARYRLYADAASDTVLARYKDAVTYLTRLASGQISLGVALPPPAASSAVGVDFYAPSDVMSASPFAD